jgi:hypothetical protein
VFACVFVVVLLQLIGECSLVELSAPSEDRSYLLEKQIIRIPLHDLRTPGPA